MAYSGNREQDDEQMLLQQAMGGDSPVNQTQPAGGGMQIQPVAAAMQQPAAQPAAPSGNGMDARKALGGYANVGTMLGFNTALDYGNDKAANSVKNTFGRIASRYEAKPSSLAKIAADPDFQRMFPGASFDSKDRLTLPGTLSDFESGVPVTAVDVLGSADPNSDSAAGWTWQDLANDGGGDQGGGGGGMIGGDPLAALGGGGSALDQLGNSDVLAQILSALQEAGGGDSQQSLAALLGGQ